MASFFLCSRYALFYTRAICGRFGWSFCQNCCAILGVIRVPHYAGSGHEYDSPYTCIGTCSVQYVPKPRVRDGRGAQRSRVRSTRDGTPGQPARALFVYARQICTDLAGVQCTEWAWVCIPQNYTPGNFGWCVTVARRVWLVAVAPCPTARRGSSVENITGYYKIARAWRAQSAMPS